MYKISFKLVVMLFYEAKPIITFVTHDFQTLNVDPYMRNDQTSKLPPSRLACVGTNNEKNSNQITSHN
jgi:hypothetical protein